MSTTDPNQLSIDLYQIHRDTDQSGSVVDDSEQSATIPFPVQGDDESRTFVDTGIHTKIDGIGEVVKKAAPHVLEALSKYSKASSRRGLITAIKDDYPGIRKRFSLESIPGLEVKESIYTRLGSAAVRDAYDMSSVIDSGLWSRDEIDDASRMAVQEFEYEFVGPNNEEARKKLKKSLEELIK